MTKTEPSPELVGRANAIADAESGHEQATIEWAIFRRGVLYGLSALTEAAEARDADLRHRVQLLLQYRLILADCTDDPNQKFEIKYCLDGLEASLQRSVKHG